jgi:putative transposase
MVRAEVAPSVRLYDSLVGRPATPYPLDRVHRQFRAARPNALRVPDFTYVATWHGSCLCCLRHRCLARRSVRWRVSGAAQTGFVLDALERALHDCRSVRRDELIHHSDHSVQYLSIRYNERLAEAAIEPSVGSVGDSYDCEFMVLPRRT